MSPAINALPASHRGDPPGTLRFTDDHDMRYYSDGESGSIEGVRFIVSDEHVRRALIAREYAADAERNSASTDRYEDYDLSDWPAVSMRMMRASLEAALNGSPEQYAGSPVRRAA